MTRFTLKSTAKSSTERRNIHVARPVQLSVSAESRPAGKLSKVFLICAASSKYSDEEGEPEWIRVTYVCRYWRRTALECLELWAKLSLRIPNSPKS
ncbi:hypothetical protein FA13DRAFT_1732345 [Coprinellus micaceus]|uniref:Uncharacterized protein n=1 Tax=Coprinellus micaceus TaxID=71717 RepID=A0A4Y7TC40_COPMI|nr:hypothetical protein FA13DRAFT_1732345 [Coprinellus micaceus]